VNSLSVSRILNFRPLKFPLKAPKPRHLLSGALLLGVVGIVGATAIQWQIQSSTRPYIYQALEEVPERPVALVFGAGILRNGQPSPILRERIQAAADLYKSGKVKKLLVTGDNGSLDYNEVAVMRRYAMKLGVPGQDVVKDHAGFRTYDSCYRARDVFEVKSAVLVTQEFHLPRAVYLARRMGIDAVGLTADYHDDAQSRPFHLREWLARTVAWVQVNVTHPRPRFLGPKIPFDGIASSPQPASHQL
jgi:vancomycin permeability regulator SanA